MGWLDWVEFGRDFSVSGGLGQVGSTIAKVLKYVNAFKARLDKIRLSRAVKLLVVLGWVGFGQSADGLGWIGSHKMDPRTTLLKLQPRSRDF